jgi:hypothetical protein
VYRVSGRRVDAQIVTSSVEIERPGELSNASVERDGTEISTPSRMLTTADDTRSMTLVVERKVRRNAFSATFEVWDMCGAWQSFTGADRPCAEP